MKCVDRLWCVWYVVWCGVVWCGAVRCGAVRCGAAPCRAVLHCGMPCPCWAVPLCCAVLCAVLCCAVLCCMPCFVVLCCALRTVGDCALVQGAAPPCGGALYEAIHNCPSHGPSIQNKRCPLPCPQDLKSRAVAPIMTLSSFKDSVTAVHIRGTSIATGCVDGYVRTFDVRVGKVRVSVRARPRAAE